MFPYHIAQEYILVTLFSATKHTSRTQFTTRHGEHQTQIILTLEYPMSHISVKIQK